jgi:flagellar hook-length control protein FliK
MRRGALDTAAIDAGAAELGAENADSSDDADGEDSVEDLDDPLAFLAGLVAVAPAPHSHTRTQASGSGLAGEGGEAPAPLPGDPKSSGLPLSADAPANATNTKADGDAAARALAMQAGLTNMARVQEEPAAPARALDFLSPANRTAAPGNAPHAPIATHVRDPRWAEDFSARIATLVNQRESVAAISLTPMDLGPVDVSVTVRDSQATIHFGAAQAETRALIEASLPKLRELLAAQGFQLMDASVSQGFTRQSRPDAPSVPRPSAGVEEVTPVASQSAAINGLLDTYA